ncbi:hypothetical protein BH09MYX1_BH09MYX1_38530 [soil metagenome]
MSCGARTPLDDQKRSGPQCGNGVLDPNEGCDDGNTVDTDACRSSCVHASCGDGVVWAGVEVCDDGNVVSGDACPANCGPITCGDGIVQPPEACDDANQDQTDACLSSCVHAFCGDGFVETNVEACDDANAISTDACVACQPPRCGDGFVWAGHEACDDGNLIDDDDCQNDCKPPVCGDGRRAGPETCDLGSANTDRPAFEVSQPTTPAFGTNALVRKQTAAAFYNYFSASSHTGFEAPGESRTYMYVDGNTGRLSLFVTHGQDGTQGSAHVNMDISGIPFGFTNDVADDKPSEFFASGPTTASGRWSFDSNSDGGVIGGLPFPGTWKIVIAPNFIDGISAWGFVKADLSRSPLKLGEPVTIQAYDSAGTCRTSCTIPRCGDGILDGGEVCDDGNVVSGDGCAADCRSL